MSHKRSRATRWFLTLVAAIVPAIGFVVLSAAPAAAVICGPIPIEGQVISCMPTASVTIGPAAPGSVRVDVSDLISITGGPKLWTMTLGSPTAPVVIGDLASISLVVTTNADPFVAYGFAVTNFSTTTLDVDALFSSPYVGGPYTALFSSHSGSTTDSGVTPNGTVTIGAPEGFVHQPFVDVSNVDGLNTGCTVSTVPAGSGNCPPAGLSTTVPVTTGATGIFGVEVHFTLSPGDIYTVNGRVDLLPTQGPQVPEPATLLMIAGGVVALAVRRRRDWAQLRGN